MSTRSSSSSSRTVTMVSVTMLILQCKGGLIPQLSLLSAAAGGQVDLVSWLVSSADQWCKRGGSGGGRGGAVGSSSRRWSKCYCKIRLTCMWLTG